MDRRDFFFKQKVQEGELDAAFDGVENADRANTTDQGITGLCFGLELVENAVPDMNVQILGPGAGYDDLGQRIGVSVTQLVDVSLDSSSVSTSVTTPGNEKIVAVLLKFLRAQSDPRIDGNSNTVYFVNDESFEIKVIQGAEGPHPATPPTKLSHSLLLGDITLIFGQTSVLDADISIDRRDDQVVITSSNLGTLRAGRISDAFQQLVDAIDTFVGGAAAAIAYAGGGAWADGTTNPATNVEAQLDKIISDLATGNGTAKLHGPLMSDSPDSIVAGTLAAQLVSMLSHINDRLKLSGGTLTGDLLPSATGKNLGDNTHRWNLLANTINALAGVTLQSTLNVTGASTLAALEADSVLSDNDVTATGDFKYAAPVSKVFMVPLDTFDTDGDWTSDENVDGSHFPTDIGITKGGGGVAMIVVPITRHLPVGSRVSLASIAGPDVKGGSLSWSIIKVTPGAAGVQTIISMHNGGGYQTVGLDILAPNGPSVLSLSGTPTDLDIDADSSYYFVAAANNTTPPTLRNLLVGVNQTIVNG